MTSLAYGDLPPDPRRGRPKGSPARLLAAARREAVLTLLAAAVPFAVAGAALGARPVWSATTVATGALALALGLAALAAPRVLPLAGAAAGLALFGVAGLGGTLAPALPPLAALALLAVPPLLFLCGLRLHAAGLAVDTGGAGPRRAPWRRALHVRRSADALVAPRLGAPELVGRLVRLAALGLAAGPVVVLESVAHATHAFGARLAGKTVTRVHASADLAHLAEAAAAAGHAAQAWGGSLVLAPGVADARRLDKDVAADERGVRVTRSRVTLPRVEACETLVLVGAPAALRRARRVVEHDLAFAATFTWCAEARRLEKRLNAFHLDAGAASTVEERSLLLQELQRLEGIAVHRAWTGEERTVLVQKLHRLRIALQDALLNDPVGVKDGRRQTAPGAVLAPDLGALVEAGGLAAVRSVTYVATWIAPVDAPSGEWEIAVNATTHRFDRASSAAVLRALSEKGATYFVDAQRVARFVPPPSNTDAVVAEVARAAREDLKLKDAWLDPALLDVVYVPYVTTPDGRFLDALTGKEAEDVRDALPPAVPRAVLVD